MGASLKFGGQKPGPTEMITIPGVAGYGTIAGQKQSPTVKIDAAHLTGELRFTALPSFPVASTQWTPTML